MTPRPYQKFAYEKALEAIESGNKRPLIVLPTGTGKSLVIALLSKHFADVGKMCLVLAHVSELLGQNAKTLTKISSTEQGIYSAGLGRKDFGNVTFASVQSLAKAGNIPKFDVVIIDEAHRVPANGGEYNALLDELQRFNPALVVIGLTATPYRLGHGRIDTDIFNPACVDYGKGNLYVRFEQEGYLCPLVAPPLQLVATDKLKIDKRTGDFRKADLAKFLLDASLRQTLDDAKAHTEKRQAVMYFCSSLEQAEQVATYTGGQIVSGKTPKKDRAKIIADFKAGRLHTLVNVDVLTTGFDAPNVDCLVFLRPTASRGLWVQMLGRGTRCNYAPGYDIGTRDGRLAAIAASSKRDCLVLDYVGNAAMLGAINEDYEEHKKQAGQGGEPMTKDCPGCKAKLHLSAMRCECGWVGSPNLKQLQRIAGNAAVVNRLDDDTAVLFAVGANLITQHGAKITPAKPLSLTGEMYLLEKSSGKLSEIISNS